MSKIDCNLKKLTVYVRNSLLNILNTLCQQSIGYTKLWELDLWIQEGFRERGLHWTLKGGRHFSGWWGRKGHSQESSVWLEDCEGRHLRRWVWKGHWGLIAKVVVVESLSRVWLCNPMHCSLSASSARRLFQARILERVAISFSRRSSRPRDWTHISCFGRQVLYHWATRKLTAKVGDGKGRQNDDCSNPGNKWEWIRDLTVQIVRTLLTTGEESFLELCLCSICDNSITGIPVFLFPHCCCSLICLLWCLIF